MTSEAIVTEARSWVGTPYLHQGRRKGQGVDCIGLVVGVAPSLCITVKDRADYAQQPAKGELQKELDRHGFRIPFTARQAGDILLMRFSTEPQHVAIFTGQSIIHAYQNVGKCVGS